MQLETLLCCSYIYIMSFNIYSRPQTPSPSEKILGVRLFRVILVITNFRWHSSEDKTYGLLATTELFSCLGRQGKLKRVSVLTSTGETRFWINCFRVRSDNGILVMRYLTLVIRGKEWNWFALYLNHCSNNRCSLCTVVKYVRVTPASGLCVNITSKKQIKLY
jgi:hypothetical protein